MEKTGQEKVQYMMQKKEQYMMVQKKKLWIDTRLQAEEMDFLRSTISTSIGEEGERWKENAAGNISRSTLIDKDNWFYETVLKKLTEKMFYDDWNNYRIPEFEINGFWVNLQKKHDHLPLHDHDSSLYSFVIFMKIPTHWKEQHVLPRKLKSDVFVSKSASDFQFVWSGEKGQKDGRIFIQNIHLSPEDEGRILFFPAWLNHQVYPFYECEEERITISGNIVMNDPNRPKIIELSGDEYEKKEKILKMLENRVRITKEELKMMKKTSEKGGSN